MNNAARRFTAGIALLLIGLSLATAANLAAPRAGRANPGVLYAAPMAQGSGDCSSWATACTLQTALAIAAPTLPSWLALEDHGDGTATLSGTPGAGDVGQHPVVLRVTDIEGAFAEQEFVITVAGAEGPRCRIYLPLVFRNWQP